MILLFYFTKGIRRELNISSLKRIDLYRGVPGHTYMPPDTEGGRMQRAARKILITRNKGFIYTMEDNEDIDPEYTVSWVSICKRLDRITPILPTLTDFHKWSDYLLPPGRGGTSELYTVPKQANCFRALMMMSSLVPTMYQLIETLPK